MNINSLEEKQLASHIEDLIKLSEKHYKPCYSDFLNDMQISIALEVLSKCGVSDYVMWGGYENADRVVLCVYPPYNCPELSEFPIEIVNLKYRKTDKLTHRDFLGSLMSLGIKREIVGDIVVGEGITSFFVKSELAGYVKSQIGKIGRVGVTFTDETVDFESMAQEFEEYECTVSSLRIDSVIGAMTKLSRSKAQTLIESGLAAKNSKIVYNTDAKVASGDKISARGYGKFTVIFDGEMTKKGKYRIVIRKLK